MMVWILESTIAAGLLAGLAWVLSKRFPNQPGLIHLAWFAAMARLVMPPLPFALPWRDSLGLSAHLEASQVQSKIPSNFVTPSGLDGQWDDAGSATFEDHATQSEATLPAVYLKQDGQEPIPANRGFIHQANEREFETRNSSTEAVIQPATFGGEAWNAPGDNHKVGSNQFALQAWLASHWTTALWCLWLIGSLMILIHLCRVLIKSRSLWRDAEFGDVALLNLVTSEAKKMAVQPPTVFKSEHAITPFVWCLGKLRLIWPANLQLDSPERGARQILIHELAHIKRRDHWFLRFELLAMVLAWWHPLFWFIRARTRFYAELACDAHVVHWQPGYRKHYASALIEAVANLQPKAPQFGALALGPSNKSKFEKRLVVIMNQKTSIQKSMTALAAILTFSLLLLPALAPSPSARLQNAAASTLPDDLNFLDRDIQDKIRTQAAVIQAKRYAHAEMWESAAKALATAEPQNDENQVFWCLSGEVMTELGRYNEALDAYERVEKSGYYDSEAGMAMASIYAKQGNTARALSKLTDLLERGQLSAHHLGESRFATLAEIPEFAQLTLKALQYQRQREDAHEAINHKDYRRALEHLEPLAAMAPKSSWVWHQIGYAALALGDVARGEPAIREAHRLNPKSATHVYNLACVAALKGRKQEAMDHLEKAVEMGFDDYDLVVSDSDLDAIRAMPAFEKLQAALKMEEDLSEKLDDIGESRNLAKALELVKNGFNLTTLDDKDRRYLNHSRGMASLKAGHYDLAIESFTEELAFAKPNRLKNASYNLACAYSSAGQTDFALKALGAAIALGFHDAGHILNDHDLENLRGLSRFNELARTAGRQHLLAAYHQADWTALEAWMTDGLSQNKFNRHDLSKMAKRLYNAAEWQLGAYAYERLAESGGGQTAFYNAACCHALAGNRDQAFEWLDAAVQAGFDNWHHIRRDSDLDALKTDDRWSTYR